MKLPALKGGASREGFSFCIVPLDGALAGQETAFRPEGPSPGQCGIHSGGRPMKRIMVVDDEENIRFLYKEELEDEGFSVELAKNGEEALEKLPDFKPDLITLDIKMPGMNGIEVLKRILEQDRELPIVLCSAYGEYKQDFTTWASDAYVVKCADLTELKTTIRRLLGL
jgi:CheY-like chemotaxis protein